MDVRLNGLATPQTDFSQVNGDMVRPEENETELFETPASTEETFEFVSLSKPETTEETEATTDTEAAAEQPVETDVDVNAAVVVVDNTQTSGAVFGTLSGGEINGVENGNAAVGANGMVAAVGDEEGVAEASVVNSAEIQNVFITFGAGVKEADTKATDKVVVSQAVDTLFTSVAESVISSLNGEIDQPAGQRDWSDCWFISSVLSLAQTPNGKDIIKNSIQINSDGTVSVTLKGAGKTYTITPEEINAKDPDNNGGAGKYAGGDNDLLVLEIALEKTLQDITFHQIKLPSDISKLVDKLTSANKLSMDSGSLGGVGLYLLTGKNVIKESPSVSDVLFGGIGRKLKSAAKSIASPVERLVHNTADIVHDAGKFAENMYHVGVDMLHGYNFEEALMHLAAGQFLNGYQIKSFLSEKANNPNVAATFSLMQGISHNATCIDGTSFSYNSGNHVFSILRCDENTVTFRNPWDSDQTEYTMTYDQFASLHIFALEKVDTSDVNVVTEIKDGNGRVTQKTYENGQVEKYEYDNDGNKVSTSYYNKEEQLYRKELKAGSFELYEYDTNGKMTSMSEFRLRASGNPYKNSTTYYNNAGQATKKVDWRGNSEEYTYDINGKIATTTYYVNGNKSATLYFKDGIESRKVYTDNSYEEYECDAAGNKLTTSCYDANGLLTKKVDHTNNTYEKYEYDKDGNKISTSYYEFDDISGKGDRIKRKEYEDGRVETYAYDSYDHQIKTDYDANGKKLVSTAYMNQSLKDLREAAESGKEIPDQKVVFTVSYNDDGNATRKKYTGGAYETYTYSDGNLVSTKYHTSSVQALDSTVSQLNSINGPVTDSQLASLIDTLSTQIYNSDDTEAIKAYLDMQIKLLQKALAEMEAELEKANNEQKKVSEEIEALVKSLDSDSSAATRKADQAAKEQADLVEAAVDAAYTAYMKGEIEKDDIPKYIARQMAQTKAPNAAAFEAMLNSMGSKSKKIKELSDKLAAICDTINALNSKIKVSGESLNMYTELRAMVPEHKQRGEIKQSVSQPIYTPTQEKLGDKLTDKLRVPFGSGWCDPGTDATNNLATGVRKTDDFTMTTERKAELDKMSPEAKAQAVEDADLSKYSVPELLYLSGMDANQAMNAMGKIFRGAGVGYNKDNGKLVVPYGHGAAGAYYRELENQANILWGEGHFERGSMTDADQIKGPDPFSWNIGDTTYTLVVDVDGDGKFDGPEEFVGAKNNLGVQALKEADIDGDDNLTLEEMQKAGFYVLKTDQSLGADGGQFGFMGLEQLGKDVSINLNSFKAFDTNDVKSQRISGTTRLANFDVNIDGQTIEGVQTLNNEEYNNTFYGHAYDEAIYFGLDVDEVTDRLTDAAQLIDLTADIREQAEASTEKAENIVSGTKADVDASLKEAEENRASSKSYTGKELADLPVDDSEEETQTAEEDKTQESTSSDNKKIFYEFD